MSMYIYMNKQKKRGSSRTKRKGNKKHTFSNKRRRGKSTRKRGGENRFYNLLRTPIFGSDDKEKTINCAYMKVLYRSWKAAYKKIHNKGFVVDRHIPDEEKNAMIKRMNEMCVALQNAKPTGLYSQDTISVGNSIKRLMKSEPTLPVKALLGLFNKLVLRFSNDDALNKLFEDILSLFKDTVYLGKDAEYENLYTINMGELIKKKAQDVKYQSKFSHMNPETAPDPAPAINSNQRNIELAYGLNRLIYTDTKEVVPGTQGLYYYEKYLGTLDDLVNNKKNLGTRDLWSVDDTMIGDVGDFKHELTTLPRKRMEPKEEEEEVPEIDTSSLN